MILALVATQPRVALVAMAYTYLVYAVVSWVIGRLHRRHPAPDPGHEAVVSDGPGEP